jgi:hypothetical protein
MHLSLQLLFYVLGINTICRACICNYILYSCPVIMLWRMLIERWPKISAKRESSKAVCLIFWYSNFKNFAEQEEYWEVSAKFNLREKQISEQPLFQFLHSTSCYWFIVRSEIPFLVVSDQSRITMSLHAITIYIAWYFHSLPSLIMFCIYCCIMPFWLTLLFGVQLLSEGGRWFGLLFEWLPWLCFMILLCRIEWANLISQLILPSGFTKFLAS